MPKKYRYIGSAPTDLACGKVVATGTGDITTVDPKALPDKQLIDAGLLVEQTAKQAAKAAATTEADQ